MSLRHDVVPAADLPFRRVRLLLATLCALFLTTIAPPLLATCDTPSVSVSYSGPDVFGHGTANITYSFETTGWVYLYFDDQFVQYINPTGSGTWSRALNVTCLRPGTHTIRADAISCNTNSASTTVNAPSSKPTASLSYSGPDELGHGTATVTYDFPNTDNSSQRLVSFQQEGASSPISFQSQDMSGTWTFPLNVTCMPEGPQKFTATATACQGYDDPLYTASQDAFVNVGKSSLDVKVDNISATRSVLHISFNFPATDNPQERTIWVQWLPSKTGTSGHGEFYQVSLVQGTLDVEIDRQAGNEIVQVTAVRCSDWSNKIVKVAAVPPADLSCSRPSGSCPAACVGHPVRVANGNMRYSEQELLPGDAEARIRTYDSTVTSDGAFGTGWTSVFDAWLRTGDDFVVVATERNDRVVFRNISGSFVQLWPTDANSRGMLAFDGAHYVYREGGSDFVRTYRSSDGRLSSIRHRSSAREIDLAYDAAGLPQTVSDSNGAWQWSLSVDGATGRIQTISVAGRPDLVWQYSYTGGALTAVTAPDGHAWRTYAYSSGVMTAAYDGAGRVIESHAYAGGNAVTSVAATDSISDIQFDLPGRVAGETIAQVTSATGRVSKYYVRSVGGHRVTVQVDGGCTSCGTDDAVYGFDADGHSVREQDARGYLTLRAFDATGRFLTMVSGPWTPDGCNPATDPGHCRLSPDNILAAAVSATAATRTTTYAYADPNWPDRATSVSTDSVLSPGNMSTQSYVFDAATGVVLSSSVTGWTGSPAHSETHTTTTVLYDGVVAAPYDPCNGTTCGFSSGWLTMPQPTGYLRSIDGPRTDVADVTTLVYYPIDVSVPAPNRGRLAASRNAAGFITRYENYDVFGNASRVVDPNGVATEMTYDAAGRVLTSTIRGVSGCDTAIDPLCATDLVTTRTYGPGVGPLSSTALPGGGVSTFEYDSFGRMMATTRNVSAGMNERIEYDYDPQTGQKSAERYLSGQPGAWSLKRSEAFAYDAFARLREIDHPDNTKTVYTYDGANNVATTQDERHTAPNTAYAYDPGNRLATVTQTLSTAPGGQIATAYAYDVQGNLTSVTDPNGNVTSYVYDDFGRMLRQTSPVTGITNYTYDEAGNLLSTTDANTATTTRNYDVLGRVLTAISSRGSDTQQVTWTYDDATAGNYGIGRLASATSDDSSNSPHYDRRGLLREEVLSIEGDAFVQSYGYDADGNRTTLVYPSGRIVNYMFDFAGRPVAVAGSMSGSTTPYVTSASYLPFGPLTSLTFGNGTAETRTFDQRYSAATIQLSTAGGLLANYAYAADGAGNVTQINDLTDSAYNRTFGYDDLNRLVTSNSGSSLWGAGAFTYDPMGNMLTSALGSKTRSFTYTGVTPLISTVSAGGTLTNMQYDAVGNELNGPVGGNSISDTRTYSPRNLLQQADFTVPAHYCRGPQNGETCTGGWVLQQTSTSWNGYDARGVRAVSVQSGSPASVPDMKYYFYTPELTQLATFAPNEGIESEVIWFGGRPVASDTTAGPDPRFTFTDHLGTPILQTDALANVVWRAEYEPFGNIFAMRAGSATDQLLRLPGQQFAFTNFAGDEESYNIFRWYRPGWGRYTQADPIGLRGALNLYAYSADNPIRSADPFGLTSWNCSIALVGGSSPIGPGAIFVAIDCESQCHENQGLNVDLLGSAVGLSAGLPVNVSAFKATVEDGEAAPSAQSLEGKFVYGSAGGAFGPGGSYSQVVIGSAHSKPSLSRQGGVSAGIDIYGGAVAVTSSKTHWCCGN